MPISKNKIELVEIIKSSYARYKDRERCASKRKEAFLKNNFQLQDISDDKKIFKDDIFKVYFVSGILHKNSNSKVLKKALENELRSCKKKVEVITFDNIFYVHLEYQKLENIIIDIKNFLINDYQLALKKNKKIVIFAHSWGGILAKTAIDRFLRGEIKNLSQKKYHKLKNNIVLVTMGTPHIMNYGRVGIAKTTLGTPENVRDIKIFTFGGIFDIVVPAKFTHIRRDREVVGVFAKNTVVKDLRAMHLTFLKSQRIHREIFDSIFKECEYRNIKELISDIFRALKNLLRGE